jgi:hypothetical protein
VLSSPPEIGCSVRKVFILTSTYFAAIVAVCVVPSLFALVAYVVSKISPHSFRLSVALARVFSFSVERESRVRDDIPP